MATHGIVGQGLGFPSRCGVRGCQVALLEDQRGRAHVKDSSEAYCPAMELRVFLRTCYIARPPATRSPQQDVIPTPDPGLSSRRTRSYSQNSLISYAKTCLLTQPEFWMRDAMQGRAIRHLGCVCVPRCCRSTWPLGSHRGVGVCVQLRGSWIVRSSSPRATTSCTMCS